MRYQAMSPARPSKPRRSPGPSLFRLLGLQGVSLLAVLAAATAAAAGEITATSGALGLGTLVNGGSGCSGGACLVTGGTGAGRNLFHRFNAFDTRGAITGVTFQNTGFNAVMVGVLSPTVIDKTVALSQAGSLFWLSPMGISVQGGGSFQNVTNLTLSTATGLQVGTGLFDAWRTTAEQAALLSGAPVLGRQGLVSEADTLGGMGLLQNGDLSIDGGLLTVEQGLLLDGQGGHVLLAGAQLQASTLDLAGTSVALAGGSELRATGGETAEIRIEASEAFTLSGSRLDASSDLAGGGSVFIQAATAVLGGSIDASGVVGGRVQIQAEQRLFSGSPILATGSDGAGGGISLWSDQLLVQTLSSTLDASGTTAGGSIQAYGARELFSSGTYVAQGLEPAAVGGGITLSGDQVRLMGASADASGGAGGGTVLVGGGLQGSELGGGMRNASSLLVNPYTSLKADALERGDGGLVVSWSEIGTVFYGTATAKAGQQGGNGGLIEVSGREQLTYGGAADASSIFGEPGTLLLDPKNIVIDASGIAGYEYQVTNIVYPGDTGGGATGLVESLSNDVLLINDPAAASTYLFRDSTGGLLATLFNTGTITAADTVVDGNRLYLFSPQSSDGKGALTWVNLAGTAGPNSTGFFADGSATATVGNSISLTGSTTGDFSDYSIRFFFSPSTTSNNALVLTPNWDSRGIADAGALTWIQGATGQLSNGFLGGSIGGGTSLLGGTTGDWSGYSLSSNDYARFYTSNSNYSEAILLFNPFWDNGSVADAGALTWLSGATGKLADGTSGGVIAAANSLLNTGSASPLRFSSNRLEYTNSEGGAWLLFSGWDNPINSAAGVDAGALTWMNLRTGTLVDDTTGGAIGAANSLLGSTTGDLGSFLSSWYRIDQGALAEVSPAQAVDVLRFTDWDNLLAPDTAAQDAGAVIWLNALDGTLADGSRAVGYLGAANALVGSSSADRVGSNPITLRGSTRAGDRLVLLSSGWDNQGAQDAGAVTWLNPYTGTLASGDVAFGAIGAANSLVGSSSGDFIGNDYITLYGETTQNLLLISRSWDGPGAANAGAVTWIDGATGTLATDAASTAPAAAAIGVIGATNSLVGSTEADGVGNTVTRLRQISNSVDENILLRTPLWDGPGSPNAGAVTWLDGQTGRLSNGLAARGAVGASNSLVGTSPEDRLGETVNLAWDRSFPGPNVLIRAPFWDQVSESAGTPDVGAVAWLDWQTGKLAGGTDSIGALSAANALVGTQANDRVGFEYRDLYCTNLFACSNIEATGLLLSAQWSASTGAATWFNFSTGRLSDGSPLQGALSAANSLLGTAPGDGFGSLEGNRYLTASLAANRNYTAVSFLTPSALQGGGAYTWLNGQTGKLVDGADSFGVLAATNSLVGGSPGDGVGQLARRDFSGLLLRMPDWDLVSDSMTTVDAGAISWVNLSSGKLADTASNAIGAISSTNALVGANAGDQVGLNLDDELDQWHLIGSPFWDRAGDSGVLVDAGAVTWINNNTGKLAGGLNPFGSLSEANSLVGSFAGDQLGIFTSTSREADVSITRDLLSSTTRSQYWLLGSPQVDRLDQDGVLPDVGAVTWLNRFSGTLADGTPIRGSLALSNTLFGATAAEGFGVLSSTGADSGPVNNLRFLFGSNDVVIGSPGFDGAQPNSGAVAWMDSSTGRLSSGQTGGVLGAANALLGGSTDDILQFEAVSSSGNGLVFFPNWDAGSVADAGALVWLSGATGNTFNAQAGGLISDFAITGSSTGDFAGYSTSALGGSLVVFTPNWDNGSVVDAGAATWINMATGARSTALEIGAGPATGAISAETALIGGQTGDFLGASLRGLGAGNALIHTPFWDNGGVADAGAATWISGSTGRLSDGSSGGAISASRSLLGERSGDVGSLSPEVLSTGTTEMARLLYTSGWNRGAGAFTWINSTTGKFADGSTGGAINADRSLLGTVAGDTSSYTLYSLNTAGTNKYLLSTPGLDDGAKLNAGALTWLDAATGKLATNATGAVLGAGSSLVGTEFNALDQFYPINRFTFTRTDPSTGATSTGTSVLIYSQSWDSPTAADAGALTWMDADTGRLVDGLFAGRISSSNSLVGTASGDLAPERSSYVPCNFCGGFTQTQIYGEFNLIRNGDKVLVRNPFFDNGLSVDAGALTWLNMATGKLGDGLSLARGAVGAANSLVGSSSGDLIGARFVAVGPTSFDTTTIRNFSSGSNPIGEYSRLTVLSSGWDNGSASNAGAATWLNLDTGRTATGGLLKGAVDATNSLVGTSINDQIGANPLFIRGSGSSFNLILRNDSWDNGAAADAGAVHWINGLTGQLANGTPAVGVVSSANALVGSGANDTVGGLFTTTSAGNLVLQSPNWNGARGAVTWLDGATGRLSDGQAGLGLLGAANSLVGSSLGDRIGDTVVASGANLVLLNPFWDNNGIADAGSVVWLNGISGQLANGQSSIGQISAANAIVGTTASDRIGSNYTFLGSGADFGILFASPFWDRVTDSGGLVDAGAVTYLNLALGQMVDGKGFGTLNALNSQVGSRAGDKIGFSLLPTTTQTGAIGTYYTNGPGNIPDDNPDLGNIVALKVSLVRIPADTSLARVASFATNPADTVTITPGAITSTANAGTNVVLQATNDILLKIGSNISVANNNINVNGGNGGAIEFRAGRSIILNSNITTDNGNLTLIANDAEVASNPDYSSQRDAGPGSILMSSSTKINAGLGSVLFRVDPSTGSSQAGVISLAEVLGQGIELSGPAIGLSAARLRAPGGTINLFGGSIDLASSLLDVSSTTAAGGFIGFSGSSGSSIRIGGSQLLASGLEGGQIDIGATNQAAASFVSLTNSQLEAEGSTGDGGTIRLNGQQVSDSGSLYSTSAITTGGLIQIGKQVFPDVVNLFNSTLIADPPATGGIIEIDGAVINITQSTFDVTGVDGGLVTIGSPSTSTVAFDLNATSTFLGSTTSTTSITANQILNSQTVSFATTPVLNGQLIDTTPQPPAPAPQEPLVTNEVITDSQLTTVIQSTLLTPEVLLSIEQSTSIQPLDATSLASSFDTSYGGEYDSAQLLATYGYVPSPDGEIALLLTESQFYYAYEDSIAGADGSNTISQPDPSGDLAEGASSEANQASTDEEERDEDREEATTSSPSPIASVPAVNTIPSRAIDLQAFPVLDPSFSFVSPAEAEAQFVTAEKKSMTDTAEKLGLANDPNAQPPTPAQIQTLLNNVIQMFRGSKQSLNR